MSEALRKDHRGEHFKILVVEDSVDDRELYKRLFKKRDDMEFEIIEAANVKDGLDLSARNHPDCILLDYNLPDATGIDFLESYRSSPSTDNTAVVMITGQGNEQAAAQAMKLGALDYITKTSILEGFFIQSILNAVERARLRDKIAEYQHKLETSNRELSEFASTASHDLKAPLRRVVTYCEFLREETSHLLTPEAQSYIDRMTVNIRRMQKLVDDLLAYSLASHTREEKENVDLTAMLEDLVEDLEDLVATNSARVLIGHMPCVLAQPTRVKQIFQNLISNAIKYRGDRDPVVTVCYEDAGTHHLFMVRDNGAGVEEKFRDSIFRPFQRLHTQEQVEGSGLGLAICQKVTEMHGGKIWVEPVPTGGSVFKFTIAKE